MKYFLLLLTLSVLFLSGCVTGTPDAAKNIEPVIVEKNEIVKDFEKGEFLPSTDKDEIVPLSNAYAVYKSSKDKPSGVYIHSGLVFVIVNIDTAHKGMRRKAKALAMLKSQELLRNYFSLSKRFSFENRQLESIQYYSKNFFRYCLAYCLKDILDYKKAHDLP